MEAQFVAPATSPGQPKLVLIDSVIMEVDDIISYHDLVTEEKAALQKGMNYGVGKKYSVFLMSVREGAPYANALDEITGMLTYEGHDEPQRQGGPNPKEVDQPFERRRNRQPVRRPNHCGLRSNRAVAT